MDILKLFQPKPIKKYSAKYFELQYTIKEQIKTNN